MKSTSRRSFIKSSSLLGIGLSANPAIHTLFSNTAKKRKFRLSLNPGAIGVKGSAMEVIQLAAKYGFEAIVPPTAALARMDGKAREQYLDFKTSSNIGWGSAGLPMDFRKAKSTFREGLKKLPAAAELLSNLGVKRMGTWLMPTSKDYTYLENFKLHKTRLKEVANVLGHHGINFGLEYVGPKTLMSRDRFAFIRTMKQTKELIHAINEQNVGFVLDSFHWYCAQESEADLLTLDKEDIVTVDLNDARAGRSPETQIDNERELPTNSGVIDLKTFLNALVKIGYDGPVRAEPFNAALNELDDEDAIKTTAADMNKAFELVA